MSAALHCVDDVILSHSLLVKYRSNSDANVKFGMSTLFDLFFQKKVLTVKIFKMAAIFNYKNALSNVVKLVIFEDLGM